MPASYFEIVLAAVFKLKYGETTAPTIPLFNRFQNKWKNFNKTKYDPGIKNEFIKDALKDIADEIIIFCQNELKKPVIRHDYQELLQLAIIFLGGYTTKVSFSFTCPNALDAPYHDLCFLKSIHDYRQIDVEVSKLVVKKFSNHLWYLSEEAVALASFDSNVSLDEKRKMAEVFLSYMYDSDGDDTPATKKYPLKPKQIAKFCKMSLHEFI